MVRRGAAGKVPARVTRWPPTLPQARFGGGRRKRGASHLAGGLPHFIGRLGADPELRYTPAGIAVTTVSLAVKSYPGAPGPDWIKLRFWRRAAETQAQYAGKGSKLHIEGKLRVGRFTDKDGVTRTTFVIDVDEFLFLGDASTRRTARPPHPPPGTPVI